MGVFKEIEKADGSGVTTFYRLSDVHDTVETDDSEGTATVIDYNAAQNKPSVNGVTLVGNKTSEDLGLQPAGDYITNDEADAKFIDEDELEAKNYVNETRLQEAIANIDHFHREIVNALPVTGQDNVLYMVRKQGSGEDIFNEYIWVGKTVSETGYEFIGTTATDLTDYYQKDEVDDLLDGKVDKVSGRGLSEQNYTLSEKTKLAGLHNYDDTELQVKVANLHNYDDTDLQLRVGDLEVKEEADINAISTIQDALDKKMICIRLVEQGDGWTWMDINGSRLTFDRAQAYLGQENCMLFVEQLENDGKVIPAEYKSETTRIRVLFKDLDSLVHIMTLGEEDLLVEDVITTEDGVCDFEVENEAVDFGARLDEFYGNTSQEVIAAEAGTEVVDKTISINDVNTSKENYIILKGDTSQDSTTGKNLLNVSNSYSITTQDTKTINLPTGTYTLSCTNLTTNTETNACLIQLTGESTQQVYMYYNDKKVTFTTTEAKTSIKIYSGTTYANSEGKTTTFTDLMLESGSTQTSYEPYTGGNPAPNPDFPMEVKVVEKDNTIHIEGENLLDEEYYNNADLYNINVYKNTLTNIKGRRTLYTKCGLKEGKTTISGLYLLLCNNPQPNMASSVQRWFVNNGEISTGTSSDFSAYDDIYLSWYPSSVTPSQIFETYNLMVSVSPIEDYKPYTGTDYPLNLGVENLFNPALLSQEEGYNTYDSSTGLWTTTSSTNWYRSILYDVSADATRNINKLIHLKKGTYTIKFYDFTNNTSQTNFLNFRLFDENGTQISTSNTSNATYQLSVPSDSYLDICRTNSTGTLSFSKVQIEEGSIAHSYSEYGVEPIELCKIENNQDYFYKKNNNWYIHKEVGKTIFNDCVASGTGAGGTTYMITLGNISAMPSQNWGYGYCDYFVRGTDKIYNVIRFGANNRQIFIYSNDNRFQDKTSTDTWLSAHPLTVYYQLETPTDILVTNSTLSSQLDALYNATLYTTTNIDADASGLSPYIDLKYNVVTPAPSPDRPSEIKVVKGNNNIKVHNKNLFDGVLELGNWNTNNGSKLVNTSFIINSHPIPVKELTNYKISLESEDIDMYIFEYKKDMSYNLTARKLVRGDSYLTTETGTAYINFRPMNQNTNLHARIQVEEGTTKTGYVPGRTQIFPLSLGQIELRKIGNYQDKIYKQNDTWYLHKEIDKVILNGSETWGGYTPLDSQTTTWFQMTPLDNALAVLSITNNYLYSDNFTIFNCYNPSSNQGLCYHGDKKIQIRILTSYLSDTSTLAKRIESFKSWLSTHNTKVYYVLATPTDTEITDLTLLTQLENLQQITQYKHTYIDLIPVTDNETPDAKFAYISNAVINASDRVLGKDTYWNDEVPTQADLPSNAEEGEIRIVQDTQNVYIYDGYEWIPFDKGGEVDLSNYLAKDNTTAWIPTGAFNPATKKYVDDSVGGVFVPTKTSQLTNDSNFIGKNSNDLTYYYTKTQTYTKSEVDALIGGGGGGGNVSITVSGDTLVITTE